MSHHGLGPKLGSGEMPVNNEEMTPAFTEYTVDGNKSPHLI